MNNFEKTHELLNGMVATEAVFMFKMYHRHFYVKGSHFFTLHKLFEDMYEEAADNFDEIAERLLSIGGRPYSTMSQFLEHSTLEEHQQDKDISDIDMVQDTIEDLTLISDDLVKGITATGVAGDDTTQDLLISYKMKLDKRVWMLEAFLGKVVTTEESLRK